MRRVSLPLEPQIVDAVARRIAASVHSFFADDVSFERMLRAFEAGNFPAAHAWRVLAEAILSQIVRNVTERKASERAGEPWVN